MEAQRLGFTKCILPLSEKRKLAKEPEITIELMGAAHLGDIMRFMSGETEK